MNYKIGKSTNCNPDAAVAEATAQLKNPKLILFFSAVDNFSHFAREIKIKFPDTISMGASTFAAFHKLSIPLVKNR